MNLDGKHALVTGGAVRIGRAICERLAREGAEITVHYGRSRDEAEALVATLHAAGVNAWCVQGDLSRPAEVEQLIAQAYATAGALDILVNSAAIFHKNDLQDISDENLHREFSVNLFAPILLTKAFAAKTETGSIVNLLDRRITGLDTQRIPYVLTKKALHDFTQLAAMELAPRIRVNAVAPGAILPPPGESEAYLKENAGPIPLEQCGGVEGVAEAVVFLLTQDGITGQTLFVDGGQHLSSGIME